MSKPQKLVVDLSKPKGERQEYIELTNEEVAQLKADKVEAEAQRVAEEQAQAELEANKQAARDKLAALGLTPEEIAAITK